MLYSFPRIIPMTNVYDALKADQFDLAINLILDAPINICSTLENENTVESIIDIFYNKLLPLTESIVAARNGDYPFVGASNEICQGHSRGALQLNRKLAESYLPVLNAVLTRFPEANMPSDIHLQILAGQPEFRSIVEKLEPNNDMAKRAKMHM